MSPEVATVLAEDVAVALNGVRARSKRFLEPVVPVRAVVRDGVRNHLDAPAVHGVDDCLELLEGADRGAGGAVVVDVVATVDRHAGKERVEPHRVDGEAAMQSNRPSTPAKSATPSPLPSAKSRG